MTIALLIYVNKHGQLLWKERERMCVFLRENVTSQPSNCNRTQFYRVFSITSKHLDTNSLYRQQNASFYDTTERNLFHRERPHERARNGFGTRLYNEYTNCSSLITSMRTNASVGVYFITCSSSDIHFLLCNRYLSFSEI